LLEEIAVQFARAAATVKRGVYVVHRRNAVDAMRSISVDNSKPTTRRYY